ncbi:MAG: sugar phosphate isomerase [Pseudohongiella sp.]|nr:MAG: sugar phosphate isomerase [Pseudohongiella sp.]
MTATRNLNRRSFMHAALAVAGGLAASPGMAFTAGQRRVDNVGLQLYTLRESMQEDFAGTLARVAEIGYTEMEFAGYFGNSGSRVRRMLDDNGLTSPASHVGIHLLRADMNAELDYAAEVGQRLIIVPFLTPDEREIDMYHGHAEFLNRLGEACRSRGMIAAYHNHDFEFLDQGGQRGFDILLNETEPDLVSIELDLYWAVHAGVNPTDCLLEHPGRYKAFHVKDRTTAGDMVDVGRGDIDFAEIFSFADVGGVEHFFVEHDRPSSQFDSVAFSYDSVKAIRY